ncbi:MAG TPA: hypothetical protein VFA26_22265 [Gemmataceae bacterium]|nr:hypothetical protein [Gemmataceae bacterium]
MSGSVKYKGQPVTGGTLTLHPADGKGAPTTVNITPAGTFVATGVSPGKMKVTVETESVKGMSGGYKVPKDMSKDNKVPQFDTSNMPVYVPIPKKYASAQTTPLTWDIGKGNNKQDFELTD